MNKINKFLILSSTYFCLAAVPTIPLNTDSDIIEKLVTIDDISHIDISGGYKIILQSGVSSVLVSGTQQSIDKLEVSSSQGVLNIAPKNDSWLPRWLNFRRHDDIERTLILITTPRVSSINATGISDIKIKDNLMLNSIKSSGSSIIRINETQDVLNFNIHAEGSSSINILNVASDTVNLKTSGSSSIHINTLNAKQNTDITLSGSSNININLLETKQGLLKTKGSSSLVAKKTYSNLLDIELSGSSDMQFSQLFTPVFSCKLGGSSQLQIDKGEAKNTQLKSSGTSQYNFINFNPGQIQSLS